MGKSEAAEIVRAHNPVIETSRGRLRAETLGPLRAYVGERELPLGPPKQRAVFAALALRSNSVVARDELIDGIWGESPPATAVGSLHTYVPDCARRTPGWAIR